MSPKKKKLVVKEIKAMEPLAEVYELNPYCKYILMIKRSAIAINQNMELEQKARALMKIFAAYNLPCAVFVGSLEDIQIIELKGEKV